MAEHSTLRTAAAWVSVLLASLPSTQACKGPGGQSEAASMYDGPITGDIAVNGVRLNYIDWGGSGEPLVLVPGSSNSPHIYDRIAPLLTDRFRVLSYARRGDARSEWKGPYDFDTMTEDLRQFVDHVGIEKVNLVGFSLGGGEITRFAGLYPERVLRLVFLDAAYDWPLLGSREPMPLGPWIPDGGDLASIEAYRAWFTERSIRAGGAPWETVETYARDYVDLLPDGHLRFLDPDSSGWAQRAGDRAAYRNDYSLIEAPTLAIYLPDAAAPFGDSLQTAAVARWNTEVLRPWQAEEREKLERALPSATVHLLPGLAHANFLFASPEEVIRVIRPFLVAAAPTGTH